MKRMIAWLLLLGMLFSLPATASGVSPAVLTRAFEIIATMETGTNYGSVSNDSNGSPSVGVLQWNASRAVALLKAIIEDNPSSAKTLLGGALYQELTGASATAWNSRKLSSSEKVSIGKLLGTPQGIARQKVLAEKDITRYLEAAMDMGIRDANALVYYADIAHQTGAGKKYADRAKTLAGSYGAITLDTLYKSALHFATYTKNRRVKVYNLLKQNPVKGSSSEQAESSVNPKSVRIDPAGPIRIPCGDSRALQAVVSPEGAKCDVVWKSSNSSVVEVGQDGTILAKKPGVARIAVRTANGKTSRVRVKVLKVRVKNIALSGASAMSVGQISQLQWTISPQNATNQRLAWKSSNRRILRVNSRGQVKALRKGSATIWCQSRDGGKVRAKFSITVS